MYCNLIIHGAIDMENDLPSSFATCIQIEDRKELTSKSEEITIQDAVYNCRWNYTDGKFVDNGFRAKNIFIPSEDIKDIIFDIYQDDTKKGKGRAYFTQWSKIVRISNDIYA